MHVEDRHALLFEPTSRQNSPDLTYAPTVWEPMPEHPCLSPERSPTPAPACPQSPLATDSHEDAGGLLRWGPAQPPRPQRHVTLFASVEMAPPRRSSPDPAVCSPSLPASEQPRRPTQLPQSQCMSALPVAPPSFAEPLIPGLPETAPSTTYPQRDTHREEPSRCSSKQQVHLPAVGRKEDVASAPLPYRRCCHSWPSGCFCGAVSKAGELANSLRSVEGHLARSIVGDADAQRFVAQELQEVGFPQPSLNCGPAHSLSSIRARALPTLPLPPFLSRTMRSR